MLHEVGIGKRKLSEEMATQLVIVLLRRNLLPEDLLDDVAILHEVVHSFRPHHRFRKGILGRAAHPLSPQRAVVQLLLVFAR